MKKIIIIGATSGIGKCAALDFISRGYKVGVAGRRYALLEEIKSQYSSQVETQEIDITHPNATVSLGNLINALGGVDIIFLVSGVGNQNPQLDFAIDERTIATNVMGFARIVDYSYNYFKENNLIGHIAVISSIAGTKGLGVAASYSATKRFQNTYIDALDQLSHLQNLPISFTDIRPGFVDTALLNDTHKYPMMLKPDYAARKVVEAIIKHKRVAVIDWRYSIMTFFWGLIPRCIWCRLKIAN